MVVCVVVGCLNSGFVEMKCARRDCLGVKLNSYSDDIAERKDPGVWLVRIGGGEIVLIHAVQL